MRFGDLAGHARQIDFLRRALAGDRLAHALLFAGPAGIGKRMVADALVNAIACERAAGGGREAAEEPCGVCAGCRQYAAGAHADVMIVTLPRNKREIPIDRVRDLNQFLRLQPVHAARKAAILDDAHLLNLAGQNALLKGLEEPPPGAVVILVAHNADALLPTVRSRCQRLMFAPLADGVLRQVLEIRLQVPSQEIDDLALFADGSPGRALRLRRLLPPEVRESLQSRLARLPGARYGALVKMATDLSRTEEMTSIALEWLLRRYRQDAGPLAEAAENTALAALSRRAETVVEALEALRRRNPNRQLLLESVFLQLARV